MRRNYLRVISCFSFVLAFSILSACQTDKGQQKVNIGNFHFEGDKPMMRQDFNTIAAELYTPLFWGEDTHHKGFISPDEITVLWGFGQERSFYIDENEHFTEHFAAAFNNISKIFRNGHSFEALSSAEQARRQLILQELGQGKGTLVASDFTQSSEQDKKIVTHILKAAALIENLYAVQVGTDRVAQQVSKNDSLSQMLLFRNQSAFCAAPKTESLENCHVLETRPPAISGLYPESIQQDKDFCLKLEKDPQQKELLNPFVTVRTKKDGTLEAVPYTVAFAQKMEQIAQELTAAAAAIESSDEQAFKAYLLADAQAFRSNDWQPADEAWSKMNAQNSKWYLRLAPDEVYFEPCSRKAGFHVSFARINPASLEWQKKLDPVKNEMEQALAKLAGEPYKARKVSFHLPDFIDIILNAGDSRASHGATVGQSLPNWGPVANEGRGRTVAMTNLYTDVDSIETRKMQAESIFCQSVESQLSYSPKHGTMSTVLHEAAHNLGPAHEYMVAGKTASQIFGGPLASTMEELKAQTAALYFTTWLKNKKIISEEEALHAHLYDMIWAFGHIAQGMYTAADKPKNYSQLAAIQLGFLIDEGAMTMNLDKTAINGEDKGCFSVDMQKFEVAVDKMADVVLKIKGQGDLSGAQKLIELYVDGTGEYSKVRAMIRERWLRHPKATFVYGIKL